MNSFKCPLCSRCPRNPRYPDECVNNIAYKHLIMHGLSDFHCLYCPAGFKFVEKLRNHMSNKHPSKLHYVAARKLRKNLRENEVRK